MGHYRFLTEIFFLKKIYVGISRGCNFDRNIERNISG